MKHPKKRILVVDDEPDTCQTLFDLLTKEGFEVATALDGVRALDMAARLKPDLVVCDLRMPGMDGMKVLERMRAAAPQARFLFLTAYADWNSYVQGLVRGAYDMVKKPCPNAELINLIRESLESNEVMH